MEAVRPRPPRSQYLCAYLYQAAFFALWLGLCAYLYMSTVRELHDLARRFPKADVPEGMFAEVIWLSLGVLSALGAAQVPLALLERWWLRRMCYVVDEGGIRLERPLFRGWTLPWETIREVRVVKSRVLGGIGVFTEGQRVAIAGWAQRDLWPELERRLHLRPARETWFATHHVRE